MVDYTYNADGVRIGKSGAKTAAYTVCGTQILSENNGTNPGNLTPRAKDKNTGLSLSTIPPINNKTAAVTTIEEVNSTGNLIAVQDGSSHVSIKPRNGTMSDWIKAGTNSIWTKTLKRIVKRYPR